VYIIIYIFWHVKIFCDFAGYIDTTQTSAYFDGLRINSSQLPSIQPYFLWETKCASEKRCAVRCQEKVTCLSFLNVSGMCRLYSVNVDSTAVITSADMMVYRKKGRKCYDNRGCKLANEMTRDLCTSGDKTNITVCTKLYKWESACSLYHFSDDSMKWTLWRSQFIGIESTCIDNKVDLLHFQL
jgi:hypothetical protein